MTSSSRSTRDELKRTRDSLGSVPISSMSGMISFHSRSVQSTGAENFHYLPIFLLDLGPGTAISETSNAGARSMVTVAFRVR